MNIKAVVSFASALSLAAGAAAGFIFAKKRLEAKFEERLEHEIAEARAYFGATLKAENTPGDVLLKRRPGFTVPDGVNADPEEIDRARKSAENVAEFVGQLRTQRYGTPGPVVVAQNPNRPHVISRKVFEGSETDYYQSTYTWYEPDEVLVDMAEEVVDVGIVGIDNMKRFGEESDDENTVYIRNDNLGLEIEVLRTTEKYNDPEDDEV